MTPQEGNRPWWMDPVARMGTALSIRQRLALWYAGLLVVTLVVFSVVVYTMARDQLRGAIQGDIRYRAQAIAGALQGTQRAANGTGSVIPTPGSTVPPTQPPTGTPVATPTDAEAGPTPIPTPNAATNAAIQKQLTLSIPQVLNRLDLGFEVMDTQERPLAYAPSLNGQSLPRNEAVIHAVLAGAPATDYIARGTSSLLDVYVQPIVLPKASTHHNTPSAGTASATPTPPSAPADYQIAGVVLVARSVDDVNGTLTTLSHLLIVGDLIAVLFVSIGGWLIASAGLSPLSAVTRTARAIANSPHASGLETRVNYRGPRDEVGTLATTFNEMLQALERVTTAQRRFVADASHELRAPITTIKGSLEFVLRRAPSNLAAEDRDAMLEDAYAETERMASLVNELLLLARADSVAGGNYGLREDWLDDQLRGRIEPVELDQVAMDVFRHGQAQLRARQKQLRLAVTHLEPVSVGGDPGHIRQLALILLDNAIKYTPSGGNVTIAVERRDDRAALRISDTGIGIHADALPHIFERFYRSDVARARDEHGSGLGLAIAKWIAESHGGEIIVRTVPDQGSTFEVLLPLRPPERVPTTEPEADSDAVASARAMRGPMPTKGDQTSDQANDQMARSEQAIAPVHAFRRHDHHSKRVRAKRGPRG